MEEKESSVKNKLIEAGRKEFLKVGYDRASMRHISDAANVTTGAIYFFFKNKEAFFRAILEETAEACKKMIRENADSEIKRTNTSADNDKRLMIFLMEHREEMMILFEKADGSIYQNYFQELCEILEEAFMHFYRRYGGNEAEESIVKIIVKMRLKAYSELVHGDYTMEQVLKYSKLLAYYGDCGFEGMMKKYVDDCKSSVD